MIAYLRSQLSTFTSSDFSPRPAIANAAAIFFGWAIPAFLGVMFTRWLGNCRSVEYLDAAISEGIGPHLWNVVGSIGATLFGLFLILPTQRWLAKAANNVLVNTYAIGALTFGLLFGQWFYAFQTANLERWQAWANALGFGFLFLDVLVLNFSVWYLGYLSSPDRLNTGVASKLLSVDLRLRALAGTGLGVMTLYFLMAEK